MKSPRSLIASVLTCTLFPGGGGTALGNRVDVPAPPGSQAFGQTVTVLPNGNFVVTDPWFSSADSFDRRGAVYLYAGATLGLISALRGSSTGDMTGSGGITVLSNGNFLVGTPGWNGGRGAVTWGSALTGVSGVVSAENSLVGGSPGDSVGNERSLTRLAGGNYVVNSPAWDRGGAADAGAVTWGNGSGPYAGVVSGINSLVGSAAGDGNSSSVILLTNGNYLVRSPLWNDGPNVDAGAVTWGDGTNGKRGDISAEISLIGAGTFSDVVPLQKGNYLVCSQSWNQGRGAVTWGSVTGGVTGVISSSNSLVGAAPGDGVGTLQLTLGVPGVTALPNGGYVVVTPKWDGYRGAVTWGSGDSGVKGIVSTANSLTGRASRNNDNVGSDGVTVLANGNFVVKSPSWSGTRGAVTWGAAATGVHGAVSASNSLIGLSPSDFVGGGGVVPLTNGNFVVRSEKALNGAGAVTWGDGAAGIAGVVSSANSLVGAGPRDFAGEANDGFEGMNGVIGLSNGNYVVITSLWDRGTAADAGAVTWGSGTSGVRGLISTTNSLVGSTSRDGVGIRIQALPNSNYVVRFPFWDKGSVENAGAVILGDGTTGLRGAVTAATALTGGSAGDEVGTEVTVLANSNFVVSSPLWRNGGMAAAGAVTWASGISGASGTVSGANSLVGTSTDDLAGLPAAVTALSNGNYVVSTAGWDSGAIIDAGAVTWGSGTGGISGAISPGNSLVGTGAGDKVGHGGFSNSGIRELENGNYVVVSADWNTSRGAVTWGSGLEGVTGAVDSMNSITGTGGGVTLLRGGNYVVTASNGGQRVVLMADGAAASRDPVSADSGVELHGFSSISVAHDLGRTRLIVGDPDWSRVSVFDFAAEATLTGNGVQIADGDTSPSLMDYTDFGKTAIGSLPVTRVFRLVNTGVLPIHPTGRPVVRISGTHAADFSVTTQPATPVAGGGYSLFQITFEPSAIGVRAAQVTLTVPGRETAEIGFTIQGSGSEPTILEKWRAAYFPEAAVNTGDLEDFDADGVPNVLEFAFGTDPANALSGPEELRYTGAAAGGGGVEAVGQPGVLLENPTDPAAGPVALFVRRGDHAAAGLVYAPQFSADLHNWTDSTAELRVLAEDGNNQVVSVAFPAPSGEDTPHFFRVKVSLSP